MTSIRYAKKYGIGDFAENKEVGVPVTMRADIPVEILQEIGIDVDYLDIRGKDAIMTKEDHFFGAYGQICSDCTFELDRGGIKMPVSYQIPTAWVLKKQCA